MKDGFIMNAAQEYICGYVEIYTNILGKMNSVMEPNENSKRSQNI